MFENDSDKGSQCSSLRDDDNSSVDDLVSNPDRRSFTGLESLYGGDSRAASPARFYRHSASSVPQSTIEPLVHPRKLCKSPSSMSYMSRLSTSFLSIASSVTDSYILAAPKRRLSMFTSNTSSASTNPPTTQIPEFVIPKWTTPPRLERMTSKAELMSFLRNNDPKGYHAAIVYEMDEANPNKDDELYRKKIREEIAPIDFVEVSSLGQSERL